MKKIILSFTFLLIVHCTLNIDNCMCQWFPLPQFPTYLEVTNVKFFDENTGVLTYWNYPGYKIGILRTTNGALNWTYIDTNTAYYDLEKIDSNTIYAVGRDRDIIDKVLRSTNRGLTWTATSYPINYAFRSCSFINKDTGWVTGFDGSYKVWRTTDGGITLTTQSTNAGRGEVFFLKQKVNGEYIGWVNNVEALWKTTNSGNSWFQVSCPGQDLIQITFIDENTGWVSDGNMFKTTNGGLNWIQQQLAPLGGNLERTMSGFMVLNKDTLFGTGGLRVYRNLKYRTVFWKTTNGGTNWGTQEPDTSCFYDTPGRIDFIDINTGFALNGSGGFHTTNGGGEIIFTTIKEISNYFPKYNLHQNYPNPFNSTTNINYDIYRAGYVKIQIIDITGKVISLLINEYNIAGSYIVKFNAENLPSGIYFYRLIVNDNAIETKKLILLK